MPADVRREVLDGVAEVVRLVTGRPAVDIRPEHLFVDELRVDSLAMVEIIEGTAQRFGVRIEDEAVKGFVRVGDLTSYVEEQLR